LRYIEQKTAAVSLNELLCNLHPTELFESCWNKATSALFSDIQSISSGAEQFLRAAAEDENLIGYKNLDSADR